MSDILTEKLNSFKATASNSSNPENRENKIEQDQQPKKKGPGGIVLGKDGKPCRTCMTAADWAAMTGKRKLAPSSSSSSSSSSSPSPSATGIPADCPPDVEQLGRSTWTLLHTLTATYPTTATPQQQTEMRTFLTLFSKLYPCWFCAEDFRSWMNKEGGKNQPRLATRDEFGNWMCEAHNAVNRKLGKKEFDCRLWEERWRTGWKDGRCG